MLVSVKELLTGNSRKDPTSMGMLAEERRMRLVEWTRSAGLVDASDAADRLDVAVETVRRDLDVLQRRGLLRRVHGGAIATEKYAHEFTIPERENRSPLEKQQIAEVASKYLPEEGAVIVDGGTTCAALGPFLMDKPNLLVITNSVRLANTIAESSTQLYMLAGRVRATSLSSVGARTVEDLQDLNALVAFIGTNGISSDATFTAYDTDEALVKKSMMRNSVETIAMADHTKFDSVYPASFARPSDFDRLVTTVSAPQPVIEQMTDAGVEVVLA